MSASSDDGAAGGSGSTRRRGGGAAGGRGGVLATEGGDVDGSALRGTVLLCADVAGDEDGLDGVGGGAARLNAGRGAGSDELDVGGGALAGRVEDAASGRLLNRVDDAGQRTRGNVGGRVEVLRAGESGGEREEGEGELHVFEGLK